MNSLEMSSNGLSEDLKAGIVGLVCLHKQMNTADESLEVSVSSRFEINGELYGYKITVERLSDSETQKIPPSQCIQMKIKR